jgi:hypothetical protein
MVLPNMVSLSCCPLVSYLTVTRKADQGVWQIRSNIWTHADEAAIWYRRYLARHSWAVRWADDFANAGHLAVSELPPNPERLIDLLELVALFRRPKRSLRDCGHRGYSASEISVWQNTLGHFDAIKIGPTATPAAHTKVYIKDVAFRYEYERAVLEGYLVDYDADSSTRAAAPRRWMNWRARMPLRRSMLASVTGRPVVENSCG